jgi:hypothetical protein
MKEIESYEIPGYSTNQLKEGKLSESELTAALLQDKPGTTSFETLKGELAAEIAYLSS